MQKCELKPAVSLRAVLGGRPITIDRFCAVRNTDYSTHLLPNHPDTGRMLFFKKMSGSAAFGKFNGEHRGQTILRRHFSG